MPVHGRPRAAMHGRALWRESIEGKAPALVVVLAAQLRVGDCAAGPWRVAARAASYGMHDRGAVIGPYRGMAGTAAAPTWQFDATAVPYTVSCDNGCGASVAPVDDPVQHTLGNLPGCACGTFLPDVSCARGAVHRCCFVVTATAGRSIAPRVALRRRAINGSATPHGATRAACAGASSMPREPGAGASAKRRWPCPHRCRRRRNR